MKKNMLIFLFIILNTYKSYADPFYNEEDMNKENINEQIILKNKELYLDCNRKDSIETINIVEKFQELELIGIIGINNSFTGILLNKNSHIIEIKKDQVLEPSKIQITDINSKEIEYIDWNKSNSCKKPTKIKLAIL
ncbi:hypothetical protein [Otariodibacter sp.]|uniref:hypothetical protein n=1 Tax=Otariodibacter sp. TaxID=3030919 RepID=UPI002601CC6E|nr:hypothetical protein [Otariodibacter sp.]